ncbi:putative late blight resistance protein homolog R1A-10 isoform X2 [Ipomoea triloba]|uniref:putative late blight resistance protein homolog R1A-10 isoform X2 n=1 Tax=Ipomoea triloba TaxID=35885 RepID=UPI00125DAC02|nr:putative late blight resistance protein homolog R1A-10 isoform X2 [Ipomoea triloba]
MACVAVVSLVRTLELEFLQPHPRPIVLENELISRNKKLIQYLCSKLEFLMEQLDEKRMDGAEAIKHLETKLKDVAFRVQDEVELHVVDLYVQPCLGLRHTLQQAIKDIHDIEEEWVKLKNEYRYIMDLQGRKIQLNVLPKSDQVIMMGGASSQHASHSEDIMVGKNNEFKTIKEMLIQHPSKQQEVVSIKGMGGIGKTTLARRVYEDSSIALHFDHQAWIVASQHYNKRQMLEDLLNLKGNAESDSDEELALRIYQGLKGQRYLIVMDDVWSKEAWDAIKACFPDDKNGSRVLLTTRLAEVANYTCSSSAFSLQVRLLDQSESWNLFCQKTCKVHSGEFETIGRRIVEKCKGLPLAIVVVAGLFSKLNTLNEWENIAKALNSCETATIARACSRILSLSYNHLSYNLKACFLYLGVFPEDEEIYTNNLASLWVAEGLVKTFENESFEVVAQRHIQELVDRNLILVSKQSSSGKKVKTFRIHDLLHAFCVREAQNENLLKIVGKKCFNFHHRGFRWVSIQSSSFDIQTLYTSSKSLHSILYFSKLGAPPYLNLQNFNLLRVLYSSHIILGLEHKFCRIVYPIHLRYLSSSIVRTFNSEPFITWNLQTLIGGIYSLMHPLDFPRLCHCYCYSFTCPNCPNFVHQNLQSLSELRFSWCIKELFINTPCLKKVGIVNRGESTFDSISCIGNLAYLQQLESLKITDEGVLFKHLINNQIALLKNLKKLSFLYTRFQWDQINILSRLPRLEVLKLGSLACEGQRWRLREEEKFCQLISLKLNKVDLVHWEISGDHFPNLESLFICWCDLQEIPSSFAEIATLKSIELIECLPSAVASAKQIREEQHDQGNYNMVVIEKDTIPTGHSIIRLYER